jgi:uncharacterized protein YycO
MRNPIKIQKILLIIFSLILLSSLYLYSTQNHSNNSREWQSRIREGDIIFHTSLSSQSKAIQLATGSPYSHMGIIYRRKKTLFVLEAIQPVKLTPLREWIKRGEDGHFVIKRLKNRSKILTQKAVQKMKTLARSYLGKNYDLFFEWSDKRIYCSELVWKIYHKAASIEIGKLEKLGSFNLSHPAVKQKLNQRYGKNIPLNEPVISPKTMFDSPVLFTVYQN